MFSRMPLSEMRKAFAQDMPAQVTGNTWEAPYSATGGALGNNVFVGVVEYVITDDCVVRRILTTDRKRVVTSDTAPRTEALRKQWCLVK